MTNDNDQEFLKHLWNIFKLQEEYTEDNDKKFSKSISEELKTIVSDGNVGKLSEELKLQIPTILLEIKSFCEVADIGGQSKILDSINNINTQVSETK